jgi:hypothetical protein
MYSLLNDCNYSVTFIFDDKFYGDISENKKQMRLGPNACDGVVLHELGHLLQHKDKEYISNNTDLYNTARDYLRGKYNLFNAALFIKCMREFFRCELDADRRAIHMAEKYGFDIGDYKEKVSLCYKHCLNRFMYDVDVSMFVKEIEEVFGV